MHVINILLQKLFIVCMKYENFMVVITAWVKWWMIKNSTYLYTLNDWLINSNTVFTSRMNKIEDFRILLQMITIMKQPLFCKIFNNRELTWTYITMNKA